MKVYVHTCNYGCCSYMHNQLSSHVRVVDNSNSVKLGDETTTQLLVFLQTSVSHDSVDG